MPEYLAPGVYVEEVEMGPKPIEGVSTSTLGILGVTERGPLKPTLITSFPEFSRIYGGYMKDSYMAYAMEGFFANGGQRAYVARIFGGGSTTEKIKAASREINGTEGTPPSKLTINAIGPGKWGEDIYVKMDKASLTVYDNTETAKKDESRNKKLFKLVVAYYKEKPGSTPVDPTTDKIKPTVLEIYDNLSPEATSSDNCEKRINGISHLIEVKMEGENSFKKVFKDETFVQLQGGEEAGTPDKTDYKGHSFAPTTGNLTDPQLKTGLEAFKDVDDISIVLAPNDDIDGVKGQLVIHCETLKDRFAILQAKREDKGFADLWAPEDSQYAAFYYPWIQVYDPLEHKQKLIPPGGHMAGIYARTDVERGVHKAPANEVLRGVSDIQFAINKPKQDALNPRGVNCIRFFQGRGIRIWGARTCSSDPLWKYINVRRLFLFLEESIDQGTQWVVFEPNNEALWARVTQTIYNFLHGVWRTGALMGVTPDQGFFVKCDRTTMTQDDIDNGRLVCQIGVAPTKPAEFVIFRIAQWTANS